MSRGLACPLSTPTSKSTQSLFSIRSGSRANSLHNPPHSSIFTPVIHGPLLPIRSFATAPKLRYPSTRTPSPNNDATPQFKLPLFSRTEVAMIFGTNRITPRTAIATLQLLQNRRLTGTLDLDFPEDITSRLSPTEIDSGLRWLRKTYVIDEDAAIIARIEGEDALEEKAWLENRGGDIHGQGVFEKLKQANKARREQEEADKRKREEEETAGLIRQAEDGPKGIVAWARVKNMKDRVKDEDLALMSKEERHEYVTRKKWANHAAEGLQEPLVMSKARRIIPSFIVCSIVLSLCYLYATTYQPPQASSRLFSDTPPAASTIFTIIGLNLLVYGLWNFFPPAIRILNKYFISIPGAPNALSVVGNVFSHQSLYHLCSNMFFLWLIGIRIHDPIGRGAFLAIYMGSGVLGSFTSISMLVLRNHLNASSLGASGAVSGVIACFFALHANEKLVVWFLPTDWQEWTSLTGLTWFIGCVGLEFFALVTKGIAKTRIDHYGHLGGYLGGWIGGMLLIKNNMVGNASLKSVKDRTEGGGGLSANHERADERPGSRKWTEASRLKENRRGCSPWVCAWRGVSGASLEMRQASSSYCTWH